MSLDSSGEDELDAAYGPSPPPVVAAPADELDAAFPPPEPSKASTAKEKDKNPYDPNRKTFGQPFGDAAEEFASGIYHNVIGGYKGLYTAATTHDLGKAADAVRAETSQAYQAPRPDFSSAAAGIRPSLESLSQSPGVEGLGNFAGDLSERMGAPPLVSALAKSGAEVFGPLAAGGRTGETPPKLTAQGVVDKAAETQSMGAAGTPLDVSKTTPEMQQAIADAPGADPEVRARHVEADTLPIPARLTRGQATQDPGLISQEQNARGGDAGAPLRARFQEQNQNLIENLDEIRREAAPTAVGNDHVQNGEALINKYEQYDEPIKADISAKYKALADANGGDLPVDGKSFVAAADAALKKQMKAPFLPSGVQSILNDAREGGNFTLENFENLRTTLSAEARKAERAGDGNAAAAVNLTRDALEQLPMTGASAKVKAVADTARKAAAARFQAMDADPAYKAAINGDVPADAFIKKYVLGGTKEGLKRMQEKFADDPDASGTIKASALNYLKNKAGIDAYTNTGNFSQAGYNKARAELEPRMDQLVDPQTAQHIRQLGNVARYQQMQPKGSYVNNSNTLVGALANRGKNFIEDMANTATPGFRIGTAARDALTKHSEAQEIQRALEPGAGLKKE